MLVSVAQICEFSRRGLPRKVQSDALWVHLQGHVPACISCMLATHLIQPLRPLPLYCLPHHIEYARCMQRVNRT